MSKKNKKAQQVQQQAQPKQPETVEPVSQSQSVFTKKLGEFGAGIGWFAGKIVSGFKSATNTVVEKTNAVVADAKKATKAAYTKISATAKPVTSAIGSALTAAAVGVASAFTGVGKAIWNTSAMDVLSVVWLVSAFVATLFAAISAVLATLVLVAITAAPATALVAELVPIAQVVLAYATIGFIAWCTAMTIEIGQFQIARLCQRVHACIEQAAHDLAKNVREAAESARHALTVDAVAVAGA